MDFVKELNGTFLTHDELVQLRTEKQEIENEMKKREFEKIKIRISDKNDYTLYVG
jgi:hypothetical protein